MECFILYIKAVIRRE